MSKKTLDTEHIRNELAHSAFFERPPASQQAKPASGLSEKKKAPAQRQRPRQKHPSVRTDGMSVRPYALIDQIPPQPEKRRPERYAFQFWGDQITRLKKLKQVLNLGKDPEDREEITLSDMVRQAIDEYLNRQTREIEKRVRADE